MCTLVYINTSFGIYNKKPVDRRKVIDYHNVILAIRNGNGQTQVLIIIAASIYSVDKLCKGFGKNKFQQNISLFVLI